MTATDTQRAIDAVWRIEAPRLIAGLARIVRDVGVATRVIETSGLDGRAQRSWDAQPLSD